MALEESIDKLTASIDKLIALGGVGAAASGGGGKAATGGKTKTTAKSKFTADQVKAKFSELRANEAVGAPPLKELIGELGAADLADLLTKTDLFDKAMEGLEAIETAAAEGGEEDDL